MPKKTSPQLRLKRANAKISLYFQKVAELQKQWESDCLKKNLYQLSVSDFNAFRRKHYDPKIARLEKMFDSADKERMAALKELKHQNP